MMRARRDVRAHGERLSFGLSGISLVSANGNTYVFSGDQPHQFWKIIQGSRYWIDRIVTSPNGPKQIFTMRDPILYRMPSGKHILMPGIIEKADTCSGYLARGGPRLGDMVVDAGAYCGELTVELAILVGPSGHVFSLEPDPDNRALLQRNLDLHDLKNVTILPYAIWSHTTDLVFAAAESCASSVKSIRNSDTDPKELITIPALSPSDLFTRIGHIPDFIKMDIEGAEVEVIEALAPFLAKSDKSMRLAMASYHLREGKPTHKLITPPLVAAGYQVETGYPDHLTTWAWKN